MPVARANRVFIRLIPSARFHEKDNPGIPVLDLRLILVSPLRIKSSSAYPVLPARTVPRLSPLQP